MLLAPLCRCSMPEGGRRERCRPIGAVPARTPASHLMAWGDSTGANGISSEPRYHLPSVLLLADLGKAGSWLAGERNFPELTGPLDF